MCIALSKTTRIMIDQGVYMVLLFLVICLGELELTAFQQIMTNRSMPFYPRGLVPMGNKVYFSGEHPLYGWEWMSSDGTTEGTGLVVDLVPGIDGSHPRTVAIEGDLIYFTAKPGPVSSVPFGHEALHILDTRTDQVHSLSQYPVVPNLSFLAADNKELEDGSLLYWSRLDERDETLHLIRVTGNEAELLATFTPPERYRLTPPVQMQEGIRFVLTEPGPRLTLWGYEGGELQSLSNLYEADVPQSEWWLNRTNTFLHRAEHRAYVSLVRDQLNGESLGDLIAIENDHGHPIHRFAHIVNYRTDPVRTTVGDAVYFEDMVGQQAGLVAYDPERDRIEMIAEGTPVRRMTELPGGRLLFTIGSHRRLMRFDPLSRTLLDLGDWNLDPSDDTGNTGPMFQDELGRAYFGNRYAMYSTDGDKVFSLFRNSGGFRPIVLDGSIFAGSPNPYLRVIRPDRMIDDLDPYRGIFPDLGDTYPGVVVSNHLFTINDGSLWVYDGQRTTRLTPSSEEIQLNDQLIPFENGVLIYQTQGLWRSDGTVAGTVRLSDERVVTPVIRGDETYAWRVGATRVDLIRWQWDEPEVVLTYDDTNPFPIDKLIPGLGVHQGALYLNALFEGEVWFARLEGRVPVPLARIVPPDPKPTDPLYHDEGFLDVHGIEDDLFLEIPTSKDDGYGIIRSSQLVRWDPETRELVSLGIGGNPYFLDKGLAWFTQRGLNVWNHDGTTFLIESTPWFERGTVEISDEGVLSWFRLGQLILTDGSSAGTSIIDPAEAQQIEFGIGMIGDHYVCVRRGFPFPTLVAINISSGETVVLKSDPFRIDGDPVPSITWAGARFFTLWTPDHGHELWMTDGTPEGTRLVVDAEPGPAGSYPDSFQKLGHSLVFRQFTSETGPARWRLDAALDIRLEVAPVLLGNCRSTARVTSEQTGLSYTWEIEGADIIGEAEGPSIRFVPRERNIQIRVNARRGITEATLETSASVIYLPYLPCPP